MATPESSPSPDEAADAYREKLRSLSFGRVPGGSRQGKAGLRKPELNNGWERGIKGEHRADGSFMPYIDHNGNPIRMKQWAENRHNYEAQLDKLRQPAKDE